MKEIILVFLGSGIGGSLRYIISKNFQLNENLNFPLSTLIINVLACLLIGLIVGYFGHKNITIHQLKFFLVIGFCGGFSTFSAFSYETLTLLQHNHYYSALFYIVLSIILCLIFTYFGIKISYMVNL